MKTPCKEGLLHGVFAVLLWKNLLTVWKTYVYRTTGKGYFQQVMSTKVPDRHASRLSGIGWVEEVGRVILVYGFWIALTVLMVMALGSVKKWLFSLAEELENRKKNTHG